METYGTYRGDLGIARGELSIGEKEGAQCVELSFTSIGDMHNPTKDVQCSENRVSFKLNVNDFWAELAFQLVDGVLGGSLDLAMAGLHMDCRLEKVSDTYGFSEHYFIIPEENIVELKRHDTYIEQETGSIITYELANEKVREYAVEMGISVENHHDFATMCELMRKTVEVIHHDGVNYKQAEDPSTIAQMERAKAQDNYTNCRGISMILSGIFRAYGFASSFVECRPLDVESQELHVVCESYVPDLRKYVMFDVSNCLIYFKEGVPLSLMEIRDAVKDGEVDKIDLWEDASHNGEVVSKEEILGYLTKNMIYFRKCIKNDEKSEILKENAICLGSEELLDAMRAQNRITTYNIREYYGRI